MGNTLDEPPSIVAKLLGAIGVAGGLLLISAFLPRIPWTPDLFVLRLVVYNAGRSRSRSTGNSQ